jgi:hypothetical protein
MTPGVRRRAGSLAADRIIRSEGCRPPEGCIPSLLGDAREMVPGVVPRNGWRGPGNADETELGL